MKKSISTVSVIFVATCTCATALAGTARTLSNSEPLETIQARYDARHEMYYDSTHNQIFWYHSLKGDCDQNGVVSISDLSRMGPYLGQTVTDQSLAIAASDCDGNGEVNISDLSAMGAHLGEQLVLYNVYRTADFGPAYPLHSDVVSDQFILTQVPLLAAVGDPVEDHLRYNIDHSGNERRWFWTRELLGEEHLAGRLSRIRIAHETNFAVNTYQPPWGLTFDSGTSRLSFFHTLLGDYDQNGEINIADLSRVLANFGETGPWEVSDIEWLVDGYRDGVIDAADAFILQIMWMGSIRHDQGAPGGYNVYYLPSGGDPGPNPPDAGILMGHVYTLDDSDLSELSPSDRVQYSVQLNGAEDNPDNVLWVRPVAIDGELGARSEVLTIP